MTTAILLLMGAGAAWTAVGVAFSRAADHAIHPLQTVFASAALFSCFSCLLVPRWSLLSSQTRVPELIAWMLVSGGAACAGMVLLQAAMRRGSHGVSWGIAQGALVVPFVLGVLLFHDRAEPHRWLSLVAILAGIALVSAKRASGAGPGHSILLACGAFMALGAQQTTMSIPSRWSDWVDVARLRVPLFAVGTAGFSGLALAVRRPAWSRGVWRAGLIAASGNLAGQLMVVRGLDALAQYGLASIAYPIAVATSMAAFILWRTVANREETTVRKSVSLVLMIACSLLVAF